MIKLNPIVSHISSPNSVMEAIKTENVDLVNKLENSSDVYNRCVN